MDVQDKINKIMSTEFTRTDEPFDYKHGLCDPKFDPCAFSCEVERIYHYKAEDVFEILKSCISSDEIECYPDVYVVDITNAIIKLDDFINLRKKMKYAKR